MISRQGILLSTLMVSIIINRTDISKYPCQASKVVSYQALQC